MEPWVIPADKALESSVKLNPELIGQYEQCNKRR